MEKSKKVFLCLLPLAMAAMAALCACDSDDNGTVPEKKEYGVTTTRDDKGVWFITGTKDATFYNILEAMGYNVATDRLWQLELYRRTGHGRLSEIQGPGMLSTDIYLRTRAYSDEELQELFDALDADSQTAIQGYVDGINRRVAEVRDKPADLPMEFRLIDFNKWIHGDFTPTLQDWTLLDLLGWITVIERNFDGEANSQKEVNNAALYNNLMDRFPADYAVMFDDLRWLDDPDALTYVPGDGMAVRASLKAAGRSISERKPAAVPDLRAVAARMAETEKTVVESLKAINAYVKMGSYGFVISGTRTASGNPILYSGPQMGFDVPSIVTEGSIRAGGFNISGMTVPGMPGLIISRTPHQALAMMTGHVNSVDFYLEAPSDVFQDRVETIKVLGGDDVPLPVYRTSHGPVMSPMPYDPGTYDPMSDGPIISWKYSHWGHEFESMVSFVKFARATSMDEFAEAMEYFPASFHVLYADRDGNIAYWMTGRDPVRPAGEWRLPQGFLAPPLEWDSEILIPRSTSRNTSQGFYCGWNNRSSPSYDSYDGPFHRAHVIYDYLSTHSDLTFDDVRNLPLNIATTESFGGGGNPWKFVDTYFSGVVAANPTPARTAALAIMDDWDGHFVDGGEAEWAWGANRADAWVLMDNWIREAVRLTFEDELGEVTDFGTLFNVLLHGLGGTTLQNSYNWFQNLSDAGAPQTADAIILAALDNVLADLGEPPWGTNARGEITFNHPVLAQVGQGVVHTIPRSSRSTYGQCVEYESTGPVRIESMFPLGESGTILGLLIPQFDPNFFSMTEVYDGFEHRPFPLFD